MNPDLDGAPRVSVVIPCYNQAHYLPEAVESVVAQTFTDWEIVIVNDGSPDATSTVARALMTRWPGHRIVLHEQPNRGLAEARNAGIRLARAPYLLPLDADDKIAPQMLECTVELLDSNPAVSIAYTDQLHFGKENATLCIRGYDLAALCRQNQFGYCSLYRREAWACVGGYDPALDAYEDWDFWVACGEKGHFGQRVAGAYFHYRTHEKSMYTEALKRDRELRARVTLNHPAVYSAIEVEQARRVLGVASRGIVALMSAHNEGDVIYHVIGDLIRNGVDVYLIDHQSTDNTVEEAARWLGKGLLHIEHFPQDAAYPEENLHRFVLADVLRRKLEVAAALKARWYLRVDADEFRESPWPEFSLAAAIDHVDALGYNALQFELLQFRPVDDGFVPGTDVRRHIRGWETPALHDATQVKAWKNLGQAVSFTEGGHMTTFSGQRICPVPFILRHYPIRGETHGRRKIGRERVARFADTEREKGWHQQYDALLAAPSLLWDPATLTPYDAHAVRARLHAAVTRRMLLADGLAGHDAARDPLNTTRLASWIQQTRGGDLPTADKIARASQQAERIVAARLGSVSRFEIQREDGTVLDAVLEIAAARLSLSGNEGLARVYAEVRESVRNAMGPSEGRTAELPR